MSSPLVSVLIPCYNVAPFVKEAIDSIINQTYKNLEIWLIDDASTDKTRSILESYNDKRIKKVFYDVNTKKIGAVNDVLKMTSGSFVCFQDADDYSKYDRIQKQVNFLLNNSDTEICFTGYEYVGDVIKNAVNFSLSNLDLIDEFLNFKAKKGPGKDPTCCPSMMITNNVINIENGYHQYFSGRVAEDAHWIYRILKHTKGGVINEVLYHYRTRQGSFTQDQLSGKSAKYAYSWNLLERIIQKDIKENIDLLHPVNNELLKQIELESCEEALLESIVDSHRIKNAYENSRSFKIGRFFLAPLNLIRRLI